jgi:pre-mRNA-splicing helicase BRR2
VPDFRWDEKIHSTAETFMIIVEDVDGKIILFHDSFVLCQHYAEDEHNVTLTVPMFPLNYYISIFFASDHRLCIPSKCRQLMHSKCPSAEPIVLFVLA